jgi:hypothetical protein
MKNLILVIALVAIAMASCHKEYTCECTITDKGVEEKYITHETGTTKSSLKQWCTKTVPQALLNDTISKAECKLK